jgi:hypothetical protein
MSLQLKTVPSAQGWRWMRDGFRLFARQPLGFSVMFVAFLFAALVTAVVPLAGALVMLAAVPLLSLGFMVASESALGGGPVHPGQYFVALRGDPVRRASLLVLCAMYGAAALVVLLVSDWVDGGTFEQLQRLLASDGKPTEIDAVLGDPRLGWGLTVRVVLATLLSIPFWHAPALVHWGGQRPAQALFSSSLAVWRAKGAFLAYAMAWLAIIALFGTVTAALSAAVGARELIGVLALPAGLIFSTVFYVSLIFTFNDSFGGAGRDLPAP